VDITNDIVKLYDQAYPGTAAAPAAKAGGATPAAARPAAPAQTPPAKKN